jgi:hypothetical protein
MIAIQKLSTHASPYSTAGHHRVNKNLRARLDLQLRMIKNKEKDDNEALVFAQNANKPSGSSSSTATEDSSSNKNIRPTYQNKPMNVRCKKCNKLGHTLAVHPESKPPEQVHTINANVDDASVTSNASSIFILAQQGRRGLIDPNFLLLDRQSTINLFSNPSHVDNVCPAA